MIALATAAVPSRKCSNARVAMPYTPKAFVSPMAAAGAPPCRQAPSAPARCAPLLAQPRALARSHYVKQPTRNEIVHEAMLSCRPPNLPLTYT